MSDEDNNEIDTLIGELGLDEEDSKSDSEDIRAVSPNEVVTSNQVEASNQLISECRDIYQKGRENDLAWRWMIGQKINDAYDNETKYEESILKRTSNELDIAISDLSRFRKFYLSFDKDKIIERAQVGYTWSHFKIINDLPDGDIKKHMIAQVEKEDEAPKVKELQKTISDEKNAQLSGLDEDGSSGLGGSTGESSASKGSSPMRPVNKALQHIEKLSDFLTDIYMQEQSGLDFDTDGKEEKYNERMDELGSKMREIQELYEKVWNKNDLPDDEDNES